MDNHGLLPTHLHFCSTAFHHFLAVFVDHLCQPTLPLTYRHLACDKISRIVEAVQPLSTVISHRMCCVSCKSDPSIMMVPQHRTPNCQSITRDVMIFRCPRHSASSRLGEITSNQLFQNLQSALAGVFLIGKGPLTCLPRSKKLERPCTPVISIGQRLGWP